MEAKFFIYDANGYVREGWIDEAAAENPAVRSDFLTGLVDGMLRLERHNGVEWFVTDFGPDGYEVQ